VKGADVAEVDTWGMDCYSRQNIFDAANDTNIPDFTPERIHKWINHELLPAINRQALRGWKLSDALDSLIQKRDPVSVSMAQAVKERLSLVGEDYFRIHPKGTGVTCVRDIGIDKFTLVEEYLGVLHSPWRWFEIQDILKRKTPNELPDFYNILLERPVDDPAGYELTFVDAAAKATFSSRMSHSCDPNCQVTVMAVDGRLTIAVFTSRRIEKGEELTFDYSSVTESEKEFRSAICLCASLNCRGSCLHFAGSGGFMQVMASKHNLLHRNAILLKASREPITTSDISRLQVGCLS